MRVSSRTRACVALAALWLSHVKGSDVRLWRACTNCSLKGEIGPTTAHGRQTLLAALLLAGSSHNRTACSAVISGQCPFCLRLRPVHTAPLRHLECRQLPWGTSPQTPDDPRGRQHCRHTELWRCPRATAAIRLPKASLVPKAKCNSTKSGCARRDSLLPWTSTLPISRSAMLQVLQSPAQRSLTDKKLMVIKAGSRGISKAEWQAD